jgi:lipopolysaccharide transport system ATP-binding protein
MERMSDVVIRAEGLGKRYRIGRREAPYKTLRESLYGLASAPIRRLRALASGEAIRRDPETIWALKDVSLEIRQGEVLGIIGSNGAGKSTLLKVLARITEPTTGRVELKGRVGSLLEVGTGFHPELTGRENIYLNGAILGMRKSEIERRFDEMVAFAEIERFLDTPVKRYSSGMYVRLAFAVAAHTDPEILLVDEVLAVGDADFQKKCLGKMGAVAREGRTVLFVSHNMATITNLCERCVLLQNGSVNVEGDTNSVVEHYMTRDATGDSTADTTSFNLRDRENPYHAQEVIVRQVRFRDGRGELRSTFSMGAEMVLEIDVDGLNQINNGWLGILFRTHTGQLVAGINTGMRPPASSGPRAARETFRLCLPALPFTPGTYTISVSATRGLQHRVDYVDVAGRFSVIAADVYGSGYPMTSDSGLVFLDGRWEICHR